MNAQAAGSRSRASQRAGVSVGVSTAWFISVFMARAAVDKGYEICVGNASATGRNPGLSAVDIECERANHTPREMAPRNRVLLATQGHARVFKSWTCFHSRDGSRWPGARPGQARRAEGQGAVREALRHPRKN